MAKLSALQRRVNQAGTAVYTGTLTDTADAAIAEADIVSAELTLYDLASGSIINNRNSQNVKDANNVTIGTTDGLLTWTLQPADNPVLGSGVVGTLEEHVALFKVVYDTDKVLYHEFRPLVINLGKVSNP